MKLELLLSLSIFFLGVFIGLFLHSEVFVHGCPKSLQDLRVSVESPFTSILFNNIRSILVCLSGSAFLGTTTLMNILVNGIVVGSGFHFFKGSSNLKYFILLVLPHGIFEIPAIIIAGAAGFKIPYEIIRYLARRNKS